MEISIALNRSVCSVSVSSSRMVMQAPSIKHLLLEKDLAVFSISAGFYLHSQCRQQASVPLRNEGDKGMPRRSALPLPALG